MESILLVLELLAFGYVLFRVFLNDRKGRTGHQADDLSLFAYRKSPPVEAKAKKP
jgi:hypothetical protein